MATSREVPPDLFFAKRCGRFVKRGQVSCQLLSEGCNFKEATELLQPKVCGLQS